MKHLLWKSEINLDDYKEDLEANGITNKEAAYDYCNEVNNEQLDLIKGDLAKEMHILCIADIGTWKGRHKGYKHLANFKDVFLTFVNGISEIEVYVEDKHVKAIEYHHDGTNYYTFYEARNTRIGSKGYYTMLNDLINDKEISKSRMSYYLKPLGWWPQYVYGWNDKEAKK